MIEPAHLGNFFTIFFSSALIILFGALYAIFFTFAKFKDRKMFFSLAYIAYGSLLISIFVLADAANLATHIFWRSVIVLMMMGYFFAPRLIWHLCIATHSDESARSDEKRLPASSKKI